MPLCRSPHRSRRAGMTLVEVVVATFILAMIGSGIISSVLVARNLAEYDKQRLAAIAAARSIIEEQCRQRLFPAIQSFEDVTLDNFNTPNVEDDLTATVSMNIYEVESDGSRGDEINEPESIDRIEVEVTVTWNRTGRFSSRQVSESLSAYASPDL